MWPPPRARAAAARAAPRAAARRAARTPIDRNSHKLRAGGPNTLAVHHKLGSRAP
jgi:hypothetical protein